MQKRRGGFFVKAACAAVLGCGMLMTAGCVPKVALPEALVAPKPQPDANGEYLCPYTSDGVMCEWTDKMANVGLGSKIGGTVAAIAAQQALKNVPLVGGLLGIVADRAGEAVGRKIAIESVGGMDYIKSKSDQSFATVEDLALHMYTTYCYNEHYHAALGSMMELYPELKRDGNRYNKILIEASKDVCANNNPKCVKVTELGTICGTGRQVAQQAPVNTALPGAVIEPAVATDKAPETAAKKAVDAEKPAAPANVEGQKVPAPEKL